jgi:hypothetical protein
MNLFSDVVPEGLQHPMYRKLQQARHSPEREVLKAWAEGFEDRDGKFVREFQTAFEPCLWELYLNAYLREIKIGVDFSFYAPDFVTIGRQFTMEATTALPPMGGPAPYGPGPPDLPDDFSAFNSESTLRISNSFTSKVKKYRASYANLPHVQGRPFVLAIASYDRPGAHMAASRPIMSALYGIYHDEQLTMSSGADRVISYDVEGVRKNSGANIPLGFFRTGLYGEVSAVVYSCLATWGKLRALAKSSNDLSIFTTLHPNPGHLAPLVKQAPKAEYVEHLLDGLYVFHNPHAQHPIPKEWLGHPRIASAVVDKSGNMTFEAPDDFLLSRFLFSFGTEQS